MTTVKHLWLDLEDTVITPVMNGWFNTQMINVPKVKAFIEEFKPDHVHLFSFAIWNEFELSRFKALTKERLEQVFGIKLDIMPRVDEDIIPACCSVMNLSPATVDFQEMSNFWGKHEAFRLYMRHVFKGVRNHPGLTVEAVLLDDAVINETFSWPDLCIQGRILNIDTMAEPVPDNLDRVLRAGLGNQHYSGHGVPEHVWNDVTGVQFGTSK